MFFGIIGMLIGLVPIMTVIVSIPLLGDKPDNRKLMGVVGGLFFLILLSFFGFLQFPRKKNEIIIKTKFLLIII